MNSNGFENSSSASSDGRDVTLDDRHPETALLPAKGTGALRRGVHRDEGGVGIWPSSDDTDRTTVEAGIARLLATAGVKWHEIGQVENAANAGWTRAVSWPLDLEEDRYQGDAEEDARKHTASSYRPSTYIFGTALTLLAGCEEAVSVEVTPRSGSEHGIALRYGLTSYFMRSGISASKHVRGEVRGCQNRK